MSSKLIPTNPEHYRRLWELGYALTEEERQIAGITVMLTDIILAGDEQFQASTPTTESQSPQTSPPQTYNEKLSDGMRRYWASEKARCRRRAKPRSSRKLASRGRTHCDCPLCGKTYTPKRSVLALLAPLPVDQRSSLNQSDCLGRHSPLSFSLRVAEPSEAEIIRALREQEPLPDDCWFEEEQQ